MSEVMKVRVKDIDKIENRKYWYVKHIGESFPVVMETAKGYLVKREEQEDNKFWLIITEHAEEI